MYFIDEKLELNEGACKSFFVEFGNNTLLPAAL
jgi:hypothetical protein